MSLGRNCSCLFCTWCFLCVEYASVDRALDEMMSFMDVLEERSDSLYAKMQELLADSRQARLEMQAARAPDDDVQSKPSAEDPP